MCECVRKCNIIIYLYLLYCRVSRCFFWFFFFCLFCCVSLLLLLFYFFTLFSSVYYKMKKHTNSNYYYYVSRVFEIFRFYGDPAFYIILWHYTHVYNNILSFIICITYILFRCEQSVMRRLPIVAWLGVQKRRIWYNISYWNEHLDRA